MKNLNKNDIDFIITSLNQTWNDAHWKLTESKDPLGDMEKEMLEQAKTKSKKLMEKLGAI